MQAGADGADGYGEDEGDLLVGELFELAEDDDLFEKERKVFPALEPRKSFMPRAPSFLRAPEKSSSRALRHCAPT